MSGRDQYGNEVAQLPPDWPKDEHGRYLCSPDRPMPRDLAKSHRQWAHHGTTDDGTCADGCCDRYRCVDCGVRWTVECPD